MTLDELLKGDFSVTDALAPGSSQELATYSELFDAHGPWVLRGGSAERAQEPPGRSRQDQLAAALEQTLALVERTQYDVQALNVAMRGLVLSEGLVGCREALTLMVKMLGAPWKQLEGMAASGSGQDLGKLRKRWGRYFDSTFEHLYLWLARARELRAPGALDDFGSSGASWRALGAEVAAALEHAELRVSHWAPAWELILEMLEAHGAERSLRLSVTPGESSPVEPPVDAGRHDSAEGLPRGSGATAVLEVSPLFWELTRKLAAFSKLVDDVDFERAETVRADLQETLDHFDPALHFPGLFTDFLERAARYHEELGKQAARAGSPRHAALRRLYSSNISRFLALAPSPRGDGGQ